MSPIERNLGRWLKTTSLEVPTDGGGIERALFLDARDAEAFSRARLRLSANVPLDDIDRGDAGCALPPRTQPFVLIADPRVDVDAQIARFSQDFKGVPWMLDACFVGDDAFFDACAAADDARVRVVRRECGRDVACVPRERLRLWSPSPELATWLPRVERETLGDAWTTSSSRAACVDLGCGAGRDAVWAASRGWRVVAIDNDKKGLARCEALAEQHGVLDRVITLDVDLTKHSIDDVFARVSNAVIDREHPAPSVIVVYAVRYLHKPLMRALAARESFANAVVWVHFMRGCEASAVGRPTKAKDLLEPGELRDAFEGWDIVTDAVAILPDGRPVSEFVAIRR